MTDKGYDNPPRTNGHLAHENGAANGRDPDTTLMLLDTSPLPVGAINGEEEPGRPGGGGEEGVEVPSAETGPVGGEPPADEPDSEEPDDTRVPDGPGASEANGHADEVPHAPEFTDEERRRHLRMGEALLFASADPLRTEQIAERLPDGANVEQVLADLVEHYAERGVNLVRAAGGWVFRTATDLSFLMERERVEQRKLSRAALETLAIIAYHQPVTRAEIEDVRGVSVSKGTLDVLMEVGWVRVRGRRQTPGRPVTYGTSDSFLEHFGLDKVSDLPGLDELKAAGLLDTRMPTNISIPRPSDEDDPEEEDVESEEDLGYSRPNAEDGEEEVCTSADEADDSNAEADMDAQAASEFESEAEEGADARDLPIMEERGADGAEPETGIADSDGDAMEDGGGAGETASGEDPAATGADSGTGDLVQPPVSRTA